MLLWLKANNYRVIANPPTSGHLFNMLLKGRVDAILANNLVMEALMAKQSRTAKVYSVELKNKPLGVYFSNSLNNKFPQFLPQFNAAVVHCRAKVKLK